MFQWEAIIIGPDDTEWENGIFKLIITFGKDYPQSAPNIKFLSKMFHPNIYQSGEICLDILQNKWTPMYTAIAALQSI